MISRREDRIESVWVHYRSERHITVSFKYWRAAFYGSPPVFLVSPIFIANRRSIPPTSHAMAAAEEAEAAILPRMCSFTRALGEVAHFCANVRAVGLILWTLVGYQIAAQIWHARYFVSPSPRGPISRFSAPSTAYFACSLILANLYVRFPCSSSGKCIASMPHETWRACIHWSKVEICICPFIVDSSC